MHIHQEKRDVTSTGLPQLSILSQTIPVWFFNSIRSLYLYHSLRHCFPNLDKLYVASFFLPLQ